MMKVDAAIPQLTSAEFIVGEEHTTMAKNEANTNKGKIKKLMMKVDAAIPQITSAEFIVGEEHTTMAKQ